MSDSQIKAAGIVLNKAMSNPPDTHNLTGDFTLSWPLAKSNLDK